MMTQLKYQMVINSLKDKTFSLLSLGGYFIMNKIATTTIATVGTGIAALTLSHHDADAAETIMDTTLTILILTAILIQ